MQQHTSEDSAHVGAIGLALEPLAWQQHRRDTGYVCTSALIYTLAQPPSNTCRRARPPRTEKGRSRGTCIKNLVITCAFLASSGGVHLSMSAFPPEPRAPCYLGAGSGVQGLGFRIQGLGFGVQGLGFGVQGLGLRVWGLVIRVQGLGFRV